MAPARQAPERAQAEEFLAHVAREFQNGPCYEPESVARAVFQVLARHVTAGEIEDIKNSLPADIRALWS